MKMSQEQLRKIIKEELDKILKEEDLDEAFLDTVKSAAKGAMSGFKTGGVSGAVKGAQQQVQTQKNVVDFINNADKIVPQTGISITPSQKGLQVSSKVEIYKNGSPTPAAIPLQFNMKNELGSTPEQFYEQLGIYTVPAIVNYYKNNLKVPLDKNMEAKILAAWKKGAATGIRVVEPAIRNAKQSAQQQPAAGQQPAAAPKQGLQEKFRKYLANR